MHSNCTSITQYHTHMRTHTHTHTHSMCCACTTYTHYSPVLMHLTPCTCRHLLVVVPRADVTYNVTIKQSQGLLQVSVVDAYMHAHIYTHTHALSYCIAHVICRAIR